MIENNVPRLLVSAIAPEDDLAPSAAVEMARRLNSEATVHSRTFAHAEALIESLDPSTFDAWLILEDAPKARKLIVEVTARNVLSGTDAAGETRSGPIDPDGPPTLSACLWTKTVLWVPSLAWHVSKHAGGDVANFLLYRALQKFPDQRIGLVRIPPARTVDVERGTRILISLLERCVISAPRQTASDTPRA